MEKINLMENIVTEYSTGNATPVYNIKDVLKSAIKEVQSENQTLLNKMEQRKVSQMSKKAFDENKKYEELIGKLEKQKINTRNKSLDVYRTYKDIRGYIYIVTTHLNNHAKSMIGQPLLNDVFKAMTYLSLYVNSTSEREKRDCIEKFFAFHDNLVDKIEFCVEIKALSYKQAAHILSLIFTIETQIEKLKETLK